MLRPMFTYNIYVYTYIFWKVERQPQPEKTEGKLQCDEIKLTPLGGVRAFVVHRNRSLCVLA